MSAVILKAHFDGQKIVLDEPYELRPDSRIVVTVLQPEVVPDDGNYELCARALERAYGANEPEYSVDDVTGVNRIRL